MQVFLPAFQGTVLSKDMKMALPCQHLGNAESKQKTNEKVGLGATSGSHRTGQVPWCQFGCVSGIVLMGLIIRFQYLLKIKT